MEKFGSHILPATAYDKNVLYDTGVAGSEVYVPLVTGDQARGLIVVGSEHEHAFNDSDVRLMQTLANSMSVALENARLFAETQRLLKETEQRAAELAVINSIQQGLAAELDFQTIVDLVGDKLRAVLNTGEIGIRWYDPSTNLIHSLYDYEHGVRISVPEGLEPGKIWEQLVQTRKPIILNTKTEMMRIGAIDIPGTDQSKSCVFVPIIGSDRVLGAIITENYEREYAFSETDIRLLTTVASSMGVALENARLFDETQRLLKETEQRAAELATVNTLSQALASATELEVLIALTGEQMKKTFEADIVYVALLDPQTRMIHFPYSYGEQYSPMLLGEGLTSKILQIGQPLLINKDINVRRDALGVKLTGKESRSYLGVPIIAGKQAIGVISVQNTQQEGQFDEDDMRLLTTLASNVGVAIEKARLLDETQRRARETAAIAEVGREISATLDLSTVLQRIAEHAHGPAARVTPARSTCQSRMAKVSVPSLPSGRLPVRSSRIP